MEATKHTMKMPELLVFAKMFVVGLVAAEVCRTTYYLGTAFAPVIADFSVWVRAVNDRHIGATLRSAYWSQSMIAVMEPVRDRHIGASGGSA